MDAQVLPMRHVIETQPFTPVELERLFNAADVLRKNGTRDSALHGRIMCSLFYESSTRTRFSFESAMLRRGGQVIGTENAGEFSSSVKGESLEDAIRVIGYYADVIVLRHTDEKSSKRAAAVSQVPIINAGSGKGQHPTQALLDVYTIRRRRGDLSNLRVALMGDLKNGRTVRSLAYLLGKYPGVQLYFVSPEELRIAQDIRAHFIEHKISFHEYPEIEDIIDSIDVLYVTRTQLERMDEDDREKFATASYRLHRGLAQRMKEDAIIMHPLPRNDELSTDVDTLPQAVYLNEQIENGLLIRMALLESLLTQ